VWQVCGRRGVFFDNVISTGVDELHQSAHRSRNVCFQIATSDASSLMFFTEVEYQQQVWFALR
jgi:hypothetical protein